jgi:hypothetical protein
MQGEVRADITHGQGSTEIAFRRRFRWGRLVLLMVIVPMWIIGGLFCLMLLYAPSFESSRLFLGVWLAGWGIGGLVGLVLVLWSLVGVDRLVVRSDGLTRIRQLLVAKLSSVVPSSSVIGIDWLPDDPSRAVSVNGRRVPQPHIGVGLTGGILRVAHGIDQGEAQAAIAAMRQRLVLPRRRDS